MLLYVSFPYKVPNLNVELTKCRKNKQFFFPIYNVINMLSIKIQFVWYIIFYTYTLSKYIYIYFIHIAVVMHIIREGTVHIKPDLNQVRTHPPFSLSFQKYLPLVTLQFIERHILAFYKRPIAQNSYNACVSSPIISINFIHPSKPAQLSYMNLASSLPNSRLHTKQQA